MQRNIILASSSIYRKSLLKKLNINFSVLAANIDETPASAETADQLAERLGKEKAHKIAQAHPEAIIIGSDQVACLNNRFLTKPGNFEQAKAQLQAQSGQTVDFYTSLALHCEAEQKVLSTVVVYKVKFRHLSEQDIENYLDQEQPYDCAGSCKAEGLGISLIDSYSGTDPNALIGLPLIKLCAFLREFGFAIP